LKKISLLFTPVLVILVLFAASAKAVTIIKVQKIVAQGTVTFNVQKSVPSDIINWKTSRYLIDETSGAYTFPTDSLTATGDSARFTLQKTSGQYTFYKIFAYEGTQADTFIVQVLIPGVVEKYLYTNLSLSKFSIPVWIVLPTGYSTKSKFVTTMAGIDRAASNIATYWVPFANANNYIVAAPEFNATDWSSDAYILGNMFSGSSGTGNLNPQKTWSFNIVEQIHRELYQACGLIDSTYELWGHSAGGQFVHRLAFFLPDNLIIRYIAGNSGWYTCPDLSVVFPWGAQNSLLNLSQIDLVRFTNQNLIIMRGTADTLQNYQFNTDPLSNVQGLNRYTRAGYFYNIGKQVNSSSIWQLIDVPNVGHDDQKMSIAGGNYIVAHPITSIASEKNTIPEKFSIVNFPNPFNPSTQIVFTLKNSTQINLTIYNILGQKVSGLVNEYLHPGTYTYKFNGAGLASGTYICKITGDQINSSLKILLLK